MNNGGGDGLREWGVLGGRGQRGKIRTTVIASSIKHNFKVIDKN